MERGGRSFLIALYRTKELSAGWLIRKWMGMVMTRASVSIYLTVFFYLDRGEVQITQGALFDQIGADFMLYHQSVLLLFSYI